MKKSIGRSKSKSNRSIGRSKRNRSIGRSKRKMTRHCHVMQRQIQRQIQRPTPMLGGEQLLNYVPQNEDYQNANLNSLYYMKLGKFVDEGDDGKLFFQRNGTQYTIDRNSDVIYKGSDQL